MLAWTPGQQLKVGRPHLPIWQGEVRNVKSNCASASSPALSACSLWPYSSTPHLTLQPVHAHRTPCSCSLFLHWPSSSCLLRFLLLPHCCPLQLHDSFIAFKHMPQKAQETSNGMHSAGWPDHTHAPSCMAEEGLGGVCSTGACAACGGLAANSGTGGACNCETCCVAAGCCCGAWEGAAAICSCPCQNCGC